jgi:hypothetical protein
MSKPVIISPSYKRASGLKTHKLIPSVVYCVGESEKEDYEEQGVNVITCPDKVNGNIARARNWILDNHANKQLLIIDDDIAKIGRHEPDGETYKVNWLTPDDVSDLIQQGFDLCKGFGARLWGLNPASDKGGYREYTPFGCNSYVSGSFSGFIDPVLRYDENLPLKEDYDMTIQQCNAYRRVLRLNMFHMVKNDHGNKGGCANYRTLEREMEQYELLLAKWGSKIVRRDNGSKSDGKKKASYDINPIINVPIGGV